jgi:hypothetical protein
MKRRQTDVLAGTVTGGEQKRETLHELSAKFCNEATSAKLKTSAMTESTRRGIHGLGRRMRPRHRHLFDDFSTADAPAAGVNNVIFYIRPRNVY